MSKLTSAVLIGAVFGLGIAISGMANPAKVLNFFDVSGTWDPSLIFVMGGALATAAIGYRFIFGNQEKPVQAEAFLVPGNRVIDARLVVGSATFGVGWGITGFCPGGAVPILGLGYTATFVFMLAMIGGIVVARSANNKIQKPVPA